MNCEMVISSGPLMSRSGVVVLRAPVQRIGHGLRAVLPGDVGHLAVALAVFQHAVQLDIGEVVGDHRLGVLRVAQEDVVQPLQPGYSSRCRCGPSSPRWGWSRRRR